MNKQMTAAELDRRLREFRAEREQKLEREEARQLERILSGLYRRTSRRHHEKANG